MQAALSRKAGLESPVNTLRLGHSWLCIRTLNIQHHSLVPGPASGWWHQAICLRQPRPGPGFHDTGNAPQLAFTPVRGFSTPATNPAGTPCSTRQWLQSWPKETRVALFAFSGQTPVRPGAGGWAGRGPGKAGEVEPGGEGYGKGRGKGDLRSRNALRACRRGGGAEPRRGWSCHQPRLSSPQPRHRLPLPGRATP